MENRKPIFIFLSPSVSVWTVDVDIKAGSVLYFTFNTYFDQDAALPGEFFKAKQFPPPFIV